MAKLVLSNAVSEGRLLKLGALRGDVNPSPEVLARPAIVTVNGCGFSHRTDGAPLGALEAAAIKYCRSFSQNQSRPPNALDVGCGDGQLVVELVRCGAFVMAVDKNNHLKGIARDLHEKGLIRAVFKPAENLYVTDLPSELNVFTALRTLHWLPFKEAGGMLRRVGARMPRGAPIMVSVAGLDSELNKGYPFGKDTPIKLRYAAAEKAGPEFRHPVTLYTRDEAMALVQNNGFDVDQHKCSETDWGMINITARRNDRFASRLFPVQARHYTN